MLNKQKLIELRDAHCTAAAYEAADAMLEERNQ